MILFLRTAVINPGKIGAAMGFAHQVSGYIKNKYGHDVDVFTPMGGNYMKVAWLSRFDNLTALSKTMATLMADPDYVELISATADLFVPGSGEDQIWSQSTV